MGTTSRQDKEFIDLLVNEWPYALLEKVIDHIARNFGPEDVFPESELKSWARDKAPEDIFSKSELGSWAEENDYVESGSFRDYIRVVRETMEECDGKS